MPSNLTVTQKQEIAGYIPAFKKYQGTEQAQRDQEDRLRRVAFFQKELPKHISDFSEADLAQLLSELWAAHIWTNKQHYAQRIIEENGASKLKEELAGLTNSAIPPASRYERFISEVKGLGPASVTEMLCYLEPDRCGIWNQKARGAIRVLGLQQFVNPSKYQLSRAEYEAFNSVLQSVANELITANLKEVDLLLVDFFLYEVQKEAPPQRATGASPRPADYDHDEIRDLIQYIGTLLGFDARTEVNISAGARVDIVWSAKIGNLGVVKYAFEVQKSGSIDGLILNLQRVRRDPTVQKVVAVSDDVQLEKIKKETDGLPSEFRGALSFWPVSEVQQLGEALDTVSKIIEKIGLAQSPPS